MKKMKRNKVRMYLKEAEELVYKAEKSNNIIKKEKLLRESKKILENIIKINKNFMEAYFTLFYVYEILYNMKVVKKEKENLLIRLIKIIYNAIEIDKSNIEFYKKLMYSYLVLIQIKNNDAERKNLLNDMVKRINFIFEKEDNSLLDIYFAFIIQKVTGREKNYSLLITASHFFASATIFSGSSMALVTAEPQQIAVGSIEIISAKFFKETPPVYTKVKSLYGPFHAFANPTFDVVAVAAGNSL